MSTCSVLPLLLLLLGAAPSAALRSYPPARRSAYVQRRRAPPVPVLPAGAQRGRWRSSSRGPAVSRTSRTSAVSIAVRGESEVKRLADDRTINAVVLALVGAYVSWSIIHLDQDISRGWTIFERVGHMASANWDAYEANLRETPVLTKTYINAGIYCLADYLSQRLAGAKMLEFDLARLARNGAIGAFFGPLVVAYYGWSDAILPPGDATMVPWKILMDQTAYAAVKYSAYLWLVGLGAGKPPAESFEEVKAKLCPTLQTGWRFWPIVHMVTYTVIPPRHRILWINCVDLVWVTILASIARDGSEEEGAEREEGKKGFLG